MMQEVMTALLTDNMEPPIGEAVVGKVTKHKILIVSLI
jgi:hypothetical protein